MSNASSGNQANTTTQLAERRTGMAGDRTRWAADRTFWAADRTLIAGVSTASSMIGYGFGIGKAGVYLATRQRALGLDYGGQAVADPC